jgi:hypothetical protein
MRAKENEMLIDRAMLSVRHAASTENIRAQLCGVRVERERTMATNGHMLAIVRATKTLATDFPEPAGAWSTARDEGFTPVTIPTETCEALMKALPKVGKKLASGGRIDPILGNVLLDEVETAKNGHIALHVTDRTSPMRWNVRKDGLQFPDVDRVLTTKAPIFEVSLNAGYLADAAKIAEECREGTGRASGLLHFEFFDEMSQVRITSDEAPRMTFIVMPARLGNGEDGDVRQRAAYRAIEALEYLARTGSDFGDVTKQLRLIAEPFPPLPAAPVYREPLVPLPGKSASAGSSFERVVSDPFETGPIPEPEPIPAA